MIDYDAIRKGIRRVILSVPDIPSNVSWENREFTPPRNEAWMRESMIPGIERVVASDEIEAVGISQFSLFYPVGSGTEKVESIALAIQTAFKPDTKITDHAAVYRTERLSGVVEDEWYMLPVRLTWRAFSFSDLGCV